MKIKNLFFKNIGIKQTIVKNTFWLAVAEAVSGLLKFALLIFAVRILGAIEYGKFTFALSFVSLMAVFADLGIAHIATREFSRSQDNENKFSTFLAVNLVLTIAALVLMLGGSFFVTPVFSLRKIIWIMSFFILISSFLGIFYSFFRSRQKMEYESVVKIIQAMAVFAIPLLALRYFKSAIGFAYGYLLSNLLAVSLFLLFFHFYFKPLSINWSKKGAFNILKISWPLSIGFTNNWLYITTTSVMLGYFNLIVENGWYNASSKIAYTAFIPATLIINNFYPVLSNFFVNSKQDFQKNWNRLMGIMIFFAALLIAGGIALSSKIIYSFYGSDFLPSVLALQFLTVVMGIGFIIYPYNILLIVSGQQKKNFAVIMAGVFLNIILNFILIPVFGLTGALISVLISCLFAFLLVLFALKESEKMNLFNGNLIEKTAIASISGVLMFFIASKSFVYNFNAFISVPVSFFCYCLLFFTFSKLSKLVFRPVAK